MDLAAKFVYAPKQEEVEEIFEDEIIDGIAHCAMEQAQVWAEEARNGGASFDKSFLDELARMGQAASASKGSLLPPDFFSNYI